MGIYGIDRSYLQEGLYTMGKSIPDFLNRTGDSLLEIPRKAGELGLGIDPDKIGLMQSELRKNLHPTSEAAQESFFDPINIMSLGLDAVWQLGSMAGVSRAVGALARSANAGSQAGRLFMTGISTGSLAQISREHGLSPEEAALLYGVNSLAIYKISKLSDMVVSGIKPLEFGSKADEILKSITGSTVLSKGFNESALKSYAHQMSTKMGGLIQSMGSKPAVAGSFLEGLEEGAEQVIDSGLRLAHDTVAPMMHLDGKYNWNAGEEWSALLQNIAGGAIGGSIMHPIMKKMGAHERDTIDSFESAVANNDESFIFKMIDTREKSGRMGPDEKQNKDNASIAREVLNTMVTIRDNAGLKDVLANNAKAAGEFSDILKSSSIARCKSLLPRKHHLKQYRRSKLKLTLRPRRLKTSTLDLRSITT